MSLAAVFGDEAPQSVPLDIEAVPVDSADGSNSDMSFDQFFGTAAPSADTADESSAAPDESSSAEPGSPPDEEDAGEDDEDFKASEKHGEFLRAKQRHPRPVVLAPVTLTPVEVAGVSYS